MNEILTPGENIQPPNNIGELWQTSLKNLVQYSVGRDQESALDEIEAKHKLFKPKENFMRSMLTILPISFDDGGKERFYEVIDDEDLGKIMSKNGGMALSSGLSQLAWLLTHLCHNSKGLVGILTLLRKNKGNF